jgi:hypothetical protein
MSLFRSEVGVHISGVGKYCPAWLVADGRVFIVAGTSLADFAATPSPARRAFREASGRSGSTRWPRIFGCAGAEGGTAGRVRRFAASLPDFRCGKSRVGGDWLILRGVSGGLVFH